MPSNFVIPLDSGWNANTNGAYASGSELYKVKYYGITGN
jgi:hypothetical protein